MKLTNILKEIRIKSLNKPNLSTNEDLCDFLNQNIKEFAIHEDIYSWWDWNTAVPKLEVTPSFGTGNKTEVRFDEFGYESYHWLCPKEDLPNPGSYYWDKTEFKGVEFWKLVG